MTHRTILALCPDHYRPDYDYLFVAVAAEFVAAARMWTRVGNTASQFPPEGAVFVPRAMLPEPFRPGDTASWVVQDQPDYQQHGLSTRYRAIRTYQGPFEVVAIPRPIEDVAGVRQLLLSEGIEGLHGPDGVEVLLEFSDGWVAGPVPLEERPAVPRRFAVATQALTRPLPAWKTRSALQLLRIDWETRSRFFVSSESLPTPQEYLDFASLEEALKSTHLSGGLRGGTAPPSIDVETLTAFLQQVRTALPGPQFQTRRQRLELLLEQAQQTSIERAAWEQHLTEHPLFQRALQQTVERMRDDLMGEARRRILTEEVEHREHIRQLEQEESAHRRALEHLRGVTQQATAALEKIRQTKESLAAKSGPLDGQSANDGPREDLSWEPLSQEGHRESSVLSLTTPALALEHLGGNLERLGLRPVSARLLARTAFAAASLGQLVFVRGSLAAPVAETLACSLAGRRIQRITVPCQGSRPLDLPNGDPESDVMALLIEGINRLDVATSGAELLRLLRDRTLGLAGWPPTPVILATLAEGSNICAADAGLLAHGPVIAVDALAWNDTGAATGAVAAECQLTAWDVPSGTGDAESLIELIEDLIPLPQRLWQRNVHAAARRLNALGERDPTADSTSALLFAWVLPWLASQGSLRVDRIRERFPEAAGEEHVMRLLRYHAAHRPSI